MFDDDAIAYQCVTFLHSKTRGDLIRVTVATHYPTRDAFVAENTDVLHANASLVTVDISGDLQDAALPDVYTGTAPHWLFLTSLLASGQASGSWHVSHDDQGRVTSVPNRNVVAWDALGRATSFDSAVGDSCAGSYDTVSYTANVTGTSIESTHGAERYDPHPPAANPGQPPPYYYCGQTRRSYDYGPEGWPTTSVAGLPVTVLEAIAVCGENLQ